MRREVSIPLMVGAAAIAVVLVVVMGYVYLRGPSAAGPLPKTVVNQNNAGVTGGKMDPDAKKGTPIPPAGTSGQ